MRADEPLPTDSGLLEAISLLRNARIVRVPAAGDFIPSRRADDLSDP
jgi:hypothetical protein